MLVKKEVIRGSSEGKELMQQIYNLRLETFSKLGWIPYSKKKAELVKDEFDNIPYTTHFAVIEDSRMIGCNRVTRFSKKFKIPAIKNGLTLDTFKATNQSIAEASRLVVRQDKNYPGCIFQLVFHGFDYILNNVSDTICTVGNPKHNDLFTYIGTRVANKDVECLLDKKQDKEMVVKGMPLVLNRSTLNHDLGLGKYTMNRTFVLIKDGNKI